MPSPFPGMDPYIESSGRWGDFHGSMHGLMRAALNARLPEGYAAEIDLYVWFHEPDARERKRTQPDVYVAAETPRAKTKTRRGAGRAAAVGSAPPRYAFPSVQRKRQKYLRVVDLQSNRVVSVIELLSPVNKYAGDDREAYLTKRNDTLASGVNLIEIDLLRGGPRLPLSDPPPEVLDYYVLVCRNWEFPQFDFRTFALRDPLPDVPVPLDPEVPEVMLPLRECVDQAYEQGKYLGRLPYGEPLSPGLSRGDATWVRDLLATRLKVKTPKPRTS